MQLEDPAGVMLIESEWVKMDIALVVDDDYADDKFSELEYKVLNAIKKRWIYTIISAS
jgi:hypothetical protein